MGFLGVHKCFIEIVCLLVIDSALTFGAITITPQYDLKQIRFLDYKSSNNLTCNVNGSQTPDHVMKWLKNDQPIEQISGYEKKFIVSDNTLTIRRPLEDDDISTYTCVVVDKNNPSNHLARAKISTAGKPTAKFNAPVTVIEGEKLKLECIVTGKPAPTVEWRYGSTKLGRDTGGRIKLSDYRQKGIVNAFLEIEETQMSDRGEYFCSAHIIDPDYSLNSTEASTFVRVKERLAAVWPFLGIVAEVVVLCAIIFVYERKRNKTELDESDTDQSPEQKNTPDHGKESVRQRK